MHLETAAINRSILGQLLAEYLEISCHLIIPDLRAWLFVPSATSSLAVRAIYDFDPKILICQRTASPRITNDSFLEPIPPDH